MKRDTMLFKWLAKDINAQEIKRHAVKLLTGDLLKRENKPTDCYWQPGREKEGEI